MSTAVLLSGGMDSSAIAYWLKPDFAITVDYGQLPAKAERLAARQLCQELSMEHHTITLDLRGLGSGDLAGTKPSPLAPVSEWWPFRNQMLVTTAAMKMVQLGATELLIGALKTDCMHADGSRRFFKLLDQVMTMQEGNIALSTPAIDLTAEELVEASQMPEELLSWSHSCHTSNLACGLCRGCQKHYQTFQALGWGARA